MQQLGIGGATTADQAAQVIRGWLQRDPAPLQTSLGATVDKVETFSDAQGQPLYYVVHLLPGGLAIVSPDDQVEPIIAFSEGQTYDPSQGNPLYALVSHDLAGRLAAARSIQAPAGQMSQSQTLSGLAHSDAQTKWQQLLAVAPSGGASSMGATSIADAGVSPLAQGGLANVSDVRVAPLTRTTWTQTNIYGTNNACYNYYTPPGPDGSVNNDPCGCVATAVAQVLRFFQYPTAAIGRRSFTYFINDVLHTGWTLGGDGSGGAYRWDLMPLSPDANTLVNQCQQIGALCWDAGIASGMGYTASESDADYYTSVFTDVFQYANAVKGWNGSDNIGASLNQMVNSNLDARHPVLLMIGEVSGGGHAVVADGYGYDSYTLYHHLNCGWVTGNIWYNLPTFQSGVLSFDSVFECIYNIYTSGTGEIISGRVTDPSGNPMNGVALTAQLSGGAGTYYATTNANGIYAFCPVPSASSYTVSATASGYTFQPQNVTTGTSELTLGGTSSTCGNCWGVNFTTSAPFLSVPGTGLTSEGRAGGPFSPSSITYTVWNAGWSWSASGQWLNWTAHATQPWVVLSKTSGTLGGSPANDTVTVSISPAANSLAIGTYSDTVTFTNTTNGAGNTTFAISLTVAPPPTVTAITPNYGLNTGSVSITNLAGTGFRPGATVTLRRGVDIPATGIVVVSPTEITCTFNLSGAAVGLWDVVVTNTDTQSATLSSAFSVIGQSSAYSWTNFVGQPGSSGNADGTGNAARFNKPLGTAVDSAGNVYVADTYNNTIRKVTPAGVVTTLAGLAGVWGSTDGTGSAARFNTPTGVAVDSGGNVFVADYGNYTIRKVTPLGVVTTLAGKAGVSGSTDGTGSAARFYLPSGVAVDSTGNVYVADYWNGTIRKVTAAGMVTTLAGSAGTSGSTDGTGSAARFSSPFGVAVDTQGNVYVADTGNSTIRKVTAAGVVTTLAGSAGSSGSTDGTGSAARFFNPDGVAVDSAGNVFVADTDNDMIRKVTAAGVVTSIGGLAGVMSAADGIANAARFYYPAGIAVDSHGNLYVADTYNQRVSKGMPVNAPTITTSSPLPPGSVGILYNQTLTATGGATPYTWLISSGSLPLGLSLSAAGVITGVPVAQTTATFTVQVTGADGFSSTQAFSLTIGAPPAGDYAWANFVGQPGFYGSADGTGNTACFNGPTGVAVDSAGNMYVADCWNCTIRQVTPAGVVTTLAGSAGVLGEHRWHGQRGPVQLSYRRGLGQQRQLIRN